MSAISTQLFNIVVESMKGNFVLVLAGLVVLAVLVTYRFTKWKTEVDLARTDLQTRFDALRTDLKEFMQEIRDDIKSIRGRLPPQAIVSESPLRLTDFGEKIAEEVQVDEWVSGYVEELLNRVADSTPYAIQKLCFDYAQKELLVDLKKNSPDASWEETFKAAAYNNGVNLAQVMDVVGLVLRDKLLELLNIDRPE